MAPHLMRAQGAYKADKHATPTHAHTHTAKIQALPDVEICGSSWLLQAPRNPTRQCFEGCCGCVSDVGERHRAVR